AGKPRQNTRPGSASLFPGRPRAPECAPPPPSPAAQSIPANSPASSHDRRQPDVQQSPRGPASSLQANRMPHRSVEWVEPRSPQLTAARRQGQDAPRPCIFKVCREISQSVRQVGFRCSRWRSRLLMGKGRSWLAVAALAAGLSFSAAAQQQLPSPPPNPQLPPPAPLAGVRYDYPWEIYGGFAYSHF